jgi:hypothetical protein
MEFPGDEYLHAPRESQESSPAYRFEVPGFSVVQVNVDANGNNILNDAANEPSITFDPNDPGRMAIGWRQFDNINSNFRQAGYGFTTDSGQTWTFPGVIDPGVFRSDPVLGCDAQGNFYYNSLTSAGGNYWTNVYKSDDGGSTWTMGTFAQGGDKQWMAIDRSGGIGAGNIYEFWNGNYSVCSPNNFTRSTNGNISYESCSRIPGDPYWGTNFVSPSGELFVCGAQWGGFSVSKSSNAQNPGEPVEWDFTVPVSLDGSIIGFGGSMCPNPDGLLGQTIITMDSSGGPGNGYIYLLCSVARNSTGDPCDVMFSSSKNGGQTWTAPVRVNDDPGNYSYQWFGTMSVAPNGRIDVIWLDTREYPGFLFSALYYSYSMDYGVTWAPNKKLSDSFNPHIGWPQQNKMGDYFDMFSDEEGAHLAWAGTFNGEQDIYYSYIMPTHVGLTDPHIDNSVNLSQNSPNPFNDQTIIRYQLLEKSHISLDLYTVTGRRVASLVNGTKDAGTYDVIFQAEGFESGVYFYRIQTKNSSHTKRLIILE